MSKQIIVVTRNEDNEYTLTAKSGCDVRIGTIYLPAFEAKELFGFLPRKGSKQIIEIRRVK